MLLVNLQLSKQLKPTNAAADCFTNNRAPRSSTRFPAPSSWLRLRVLDPGQSLLILRVDVGLKDEPQLLLML